MKRSSFVAPLLIIAIGVLFMARNLYPDLPLLDFVARYWPVVLIGWGALRVVEILAWSAAAKPLPATGLSGGEWMLVALLCLTGAGLHAIHGVTSWWPDRVRLGGLDVFGEPHDYPISGEQASSSTPRVVLEDFRGDAHFFGSDGASSVKVTGHKTVRSLDQAQADRANEATPLEITGDANHLVIRLHQDRAPGPRSITATLDIAVPKGASLEVHGRRGDLQVNDISGSVMLASDNAGVQLKNVGGEARLDVKRSDLLHLESVQGPVTIKGRGSDIDLDHVGGTVTIDGAFNGIIQLHQLAKALRFTSPQTELSLEAVPGEVRMSLGDLTATDVTGPTRLTSRSHDVQITEFSGPLDVTVQRGDLSFTTNKLPLSRIQAHSRSGDIRLALPPAAQFALNATTDNGDISNNFGGALKADRNGRHGSLRGSVGNGPAIELETNRGEISIQKASPAKPEAAKPETPKPSVSGVTHATPPIQKLEQ